MLAEVVVPAGVLRRIAAVAVKQRRLDLLIAGSIKSTWSMVQVSGLIASRLRTPWV